MNNRSFTAPACCRVQDDTSIYALDIPPLKGGVVVQAMVGGC